MSARTVMTKSLQISDSLFQDLRSLIIEARQDVARQVNSVLVLLYWRVGKRIRQDILKENRAEYGEQIVSTVVGTIGPGVRDRLRREKLAADGSICRGIPR